MQKNWTPLTQIGKNVATVHSHPERRLLGSASAFLIHLETFFFVSRARWRSDAGRDWESDNFLHSWALSHLQVMGYLEECEVVYGNWVYFRAIMGGWLGHKNLFRGFENSSWQTLRNSQVCLPNWCDTLSGHTELEITNKQTNRHKPQECDLFGWMDWAYGNWKKYGSTVTNVPQVQGNHRFRKMADIWCDG